MDKIEFRQGKTFSQVLRWGAAPIIYKPITGITQEAPVKITALGHGVPEGWAVAVVSVKGMKQINAANNPPKENKDPYKSDYKQATVVDVDHVSLNLVNSSEFDAYVSGGYVQYYTPVDLTGYTARMKIKDKIGGAVLHELTTENGGIVIDNANKTVTVKVSAAVTEDLDPGKAVFDLEMVSVDGTVTELWAGHIVIREEVTTTL